MSPVVAEAPYASLAARHRAMSPEARSLHTAVFAGPAKPAHPDELLVSVDPDAARAELTLFVDGREAWGSGRAVIRTTCAGAVVVVVNLRLRDDDGASYGTVVSIMWVRERGLLFDQAISVAGDAAIELPGGSSQRLTALRWHPYNQIAEQASRAQYRTVVSRF
jgi:hypothetical protein